MFQELREWEKAIGGLRFFQAYDNKKDVIRQWEVANCEWASPAVHYEPTEGCYAVSIHNHMTMPAIIKKFEGNTKEVYDEACAWVKKNTLKRTYFCTKV